MSDNQDSSLGVWGGFAHPLVTDRIVDGMVNLRMPGAGPVAAFSSALVYVASVVIESGDEVAVFDTGFEYQVDKYILPYLASRGKTASDIKLIINSHDHFDHVDGNQRLRKLSGAKVAAHARCVDRIAGGVDRPLRDGDKLSIGDFGFTVTALPGHSDTAIGLFEEKTGVLLSGDSLCGNGDPDIGLAILTDIPGYRESIERVASLDPRVLVPAHPFRGMDGPVLRGEAVQKYLRACRRAVDSYEAEAVRLLRAAAHPMSRCALHQALVESLTWDPEEMRILYLQFLSGYSRVTVDALLAQVVPKELGGRVSDDPWLDAGQVYGTGE